MTSNDNNDSPMQRFEDLAKRLFHVAKEDVRGLFEIKDQRARAQYIRGKQAYVDHYDGLWD